MQTILRFHVWCFFLNTVGFWIQNHFWTVTDVTGRGANPIYTQTVRFTKKGPNLDGVLSFGPCKAHDRGLHGWETDWIPTAQVNKGLGSEPPVFPRWIHKGYWPNSLKLNCFPNSQQLLELFGVRVSILAFTEASYKAQQPLDTAVQDSCQKDHLLKADCKHHEQVNGRGKKTYYHYIAPW